MTTTDDAIRDMYRALPLERLERELSDIEAKIARLTRKSQARSDEYAAFMEPALTILREVIAEKR